MCKRSLNWPQSRSKVRFWTRKVLLERSKRFHGLFSAIMPLFMGFRFTRVIFSSLCSCLLDSTLRLTKPTRTRMDFSLEAFKFLGEYSEVYTHCIIAVCHSSDAGNRCQQGCTTSGRRRRQLAMNSTLSDNISSEQTLTQGPFRRAGGRRRREKEIKFVELHTYLLMFIDQAVLIGCPVWSACTQLQRYRCHPIVRSAPFHQELSTHSPHQFLYQNFQMGNLLLWNMFEALQLLRCALFPHEIDEFKRWRLTFLVKISYLSIRIYSISRSVNIHTLKQVLILMFGHDKILKESK